MLFKLASNRFKIFLMPYLKKKKKHSLRFNCYLQHFSSFIIQIIQQFIKIMIYTLF